MSTESEKSNVIVVDFQRRSDQGDENATAAAVVAPEHSLSSRTIDESSPGLSLRPIGSVFPAGLGPTTTWALGVIGKCVAKLRTARESLHADDTVAADMEVMSATQGLLELYSEQGLPSGLLTVAEGCVQSIRNLKGIPATLNQLNALLSVLGKLEQGPFVQHSQALEWIDELEDADLSPIAAEWGEIAIGPSEQSDDQVKEV